MSGVSPETNSGRCAGDDRAENLIAQGNQLSGALHEVRDGETKPAIAFAAAEEEHVLCKLMRNAHFGWEVGEAVGQGMREGQWAPVARSSKGTV